jgi:methylsterol monooxygenase
MHHTFTAPCALAATYATMLEHALSNLFPILLGLTILGSHWFVQGHAMYCRIMLSPSRSMVVYFFCSLELGTLDTQCVETQGQGRQRSR